jgi:hypothetical protein
MYHGNGGEFAITNAYLDDENQSANPTYASFSVKLNPHHWYSVQSSFPMEPNTWHQVVGMWEKGVSLQVYIDGVLAGNNDSMPVERLYDPYGGSYPSSLAINQQGQNFIDPRLFFKGQISNVMVFNKTLTNQEIIELYDCGPFEAPDDIPEFPSWAILPLVLAITLFSVIIKRNMKGV